MTLLSTAVIAMLAVILAPQPELSDVVAADVRFRERLRCYNHRNCAQVCRNAGPGRHIVCMQRCAAFNRSQPCNSMIMRR